MIKYVVGDATQPIGEGLKVIAHICNNQGAWGAGFVVALSKRWKRPERMYKHLFSGEHGVTKPKLGDIQIVVAEPDIFVCNMIAQDGLPSKDNRQPLSYDALQSCSTTLAFRLERAKANISVHMPRIGTGFGGGSWSVIEKIIEATVGEKFEVTVYDQ
jgi:O-acetyl-ADP-ribose deacetylase (regulator of RNase III)